MAAGLRQFGVLSHLDAFTQTTTAVGAWNRIARDLFRESEHHSTVCAPASVGFAGVPASISVAWRTIGTEAEILLSGYEAAFFGGREPAPTPPSGGFLTVRISSVRLFGASELSRECRTDYDCGCDDVGSGSSPASPHEWIFDGTDTVEPFDPDVVPSWFFQWLLDNFFPLVDCTPPVAPILFAICQVRNAAQWYIDHPGMDVYDEEAWGPHLYGWIRIRTIWANLGQSLTESNALDTSDVALPNYRFRIKRVRLRGQLLSSRCDVVTVGQECVPCSQ